MDRRKKRTSTNQYMMYINLMEKDPIFASGKVPRDVDMNYLSKKWKELSDKLNTCNSGPNLTAEEWRKRLNDWKNTTRCKYRRSLSGEKDITMTTLELKALELFGKAPNIGSDGQVSLHLKSEKDNGDCENEEIEAQRTSESFQKELQAAVDEAIGGDDEEEGIADEQVEQEDELLDDGINNTTPAVNTTTSDVGSGNGGASVLNNAPNEYRTIVVDNATYVDDPVDDQVEFITTRRGGSATATATNIRTVVNNNNMSNSASSNAKLINGDIPLKRLRTQTRDQIVYEVKNTHVSQQTHAPRTYTTIHPATTPITIHQSKPAMPENTATLPLDVQEVREIAHQLKRLADIKYEKLQFEIARFKFNNPGFQYNYPPAL